MEVAEESTRHRGYSLVSVTTKVGMWGLFMGKGGRKVGQSCALGVWRTCVVHREMTKCGIVKSSHAQFKRSVTQGYDQIWTIQVRYGQFTGIATQRHDQIWTIQVCLGQFTGMATQGPGQIWTIQDQHGQFIGTSTQGHEQI